MATKKEELDVFRGQFKFDELIMTAIHGYSRDISDREEKMLKELLIAFNWALDNFGVEKIYLCPELIKGELSMHKTISLLSDG